MPAISSCLIVVHEMTTREDVSLFSRQLSDQYRFLLEHQQENRCPVTIFQVAMKINGLTATVYGRD